MSEPNQGEITVNEDGGQVLGLPESTCVDPVTALKSDPEFIASYLSGNSVAIAKMTEAQKQNSQPSLTPATSYQETAPTHEAIEDSEVSAYADKTLDFGVYAQSLDIQAMHNANKAAADLSSKYGIIPEVTQSFFKRGMESAEIYDPNNDEELRETAHKELQKSWGDQYETKLNELMSVLDAEPQLNDFMGESGLWADSYTLQSLHRLLIEGVSIGG